MKRPRLRAAELPEVRPAGSRMRVENRQNIESGRNLVNSDKPYEIEIGSPATSMPGRRTLWGAVMAGAIVTLAVHITLDLLGAGIGMGLIPTDSDITAEAGARGFAVATGAWWLVTTIIAVFMGAMVAGRLLPQTRRDSAALQGLATWGLATVIWVAAMTTVLGGVLGGAVGAMNSSLAVATSRDISNGAPRAQDAVVAEHAASAGRTQAADARNVVTVDEARRAAKAASAAALWGFVGLLLSACAGCMGGIVGSRPKELVGVVRTTPRPAM
jgi:hypothetical protein